MGACCTSTRKDDRYEYSKLQNQNTYLNEVYNSYLQRDSTLDPITKILIEGNDRQLQKMIADYKYDIDDYNFDNNKTLLIQACYLCPNPNVVDMIMKKGANINKEEYNTGNTALFVSASRLKTDFVQKILNYNPNLQHRNHLRQNIFEYFEDEVQKRNSNLSQSKIQSVSLIDQMLNRKAYS